MPNVTDYHPQTGQLVDLDRTTAKRVRQLMKRDEIDWTEFLRRAAHAYDLLYSRDE